MFLFSVLLLGLLSNITFAGSDGHICTYQENYEEVINETIVRKVPRPYQPDCATWSTLWSWLTKKCSVKYKVEDKIEYRNVTLNKSRTREKCCEGWKDLETSNCTKPICEPECIHGTCYKPYECMCQSGWKGSICGDKCGGGSYGYNCSHDCNCGTGSVTCHHVTGECQCAPGFTGIKCTDKCPAGLYGFGCGETCQCSERADCRPSDGFCNCSSKRSGASNSLGFNGPTCSQTCTLGLDCLKTCDCYDTRGDCNPYTGDCICKPGFIGVKCEQECSAGTFGPSCLGRCLCLNNSTCDPVSGSCRCRPGWSGERCENPCQKGRYGVDCSRTCRCVHFELCNVENGLCQCSPGWVGLYCEQPCPAGTFGRACASACNCGRQPFLRPEDDYLDVYNRNVNVAMRHMSPQTFLYDSLTPSTLLFPHDEKVGAEEEVPLVPCDPIDGTCLCPAGRMGPRCESTCPNFKYGSNCASTCDCDHASTCDSISGICNCTLGWHGTKCEIACGKGFYGPNCEKRCDCYGAETCHPITGACICPAGKTGINCTEECSFGWYGIFCQHPCPCTLSNANATQPCDMVTGTCYCKPGYGGNCSTCERGLWGPQCQNICPCVDNNGQPASCDISDGQCHCPNSTSPRTCILNLSSGLTEEMLESDDGRNSSFNSPNGWMTILFVIFSSIILILALIGIATCYLLRRKKKSSITSKSTILNGHKKGALPSIPTNYGNFSPRSVLTGPGGGHGSELSPRDSRIRDTSRNIYCMDEDYNGGPSCDEYDIDYAYPTSQFGTIDKKGTNHINDRLDMDKAIARSLAFNTAGGSGGGGGTAGKDRRAHLYQELPDRGRGGSSTPNSETTLTDPGPPSSSSPLPEDCYETSLDHAKSSDTTYNSTYLVPLPPPSTSTVKPGYHKLDRSGDSFKIIPLALASAYDKVEAPLQSHSTPPPIPSRKIHTDLNLGLANLDRTDIPHELDLALVDMMPAVETNAGQEVLCTNGDSEFYHCPTTCTTLKASPSASELMGVRPIPPKKPKNLGSNHGGSSNRLSASSLLSNYDSYDSPGNFKMAPKMGNLP